MMTKKDFVAIAGVIKRSWAGDSSTEFELPMLAENMADYFETRNPNFDRDKFIKAYCT